jgi:hypothetical protein
MGATHQIEFVSIRVNSWIIEACQQKRSTNPHE